MSYCLWVTEPMPGTERPFLNICWVRDPPLVPGRRIPLGKPWCFQDAKCLVREYRYSVDPCPELGALPRCP